MRHKGTWLLLFGAWLGLGVGCGHPPSNLDAEPTAAREACLEGGSLRRLRWPDVGALRISEVMADPIGPDAGREWLELYVNATEPVDLAGITLRAETASERRYRWEVESEACLVVQPGDYVVVGVARRPEMARLEGLPITALALGTTVPNGPLSLSLHAGELEVDSLELPRATCGSSWGRTEQSLYTGEQAGCVSISELPGGAFGTPGRPNDQCSWLQDAR